MARILRGEIRWADLNPVRGREQAGRRPVLVVSHSTPEEVDSKRHMSGRPCLGRVNLPEARETRGGGNIGDAGESYNVE